MSSVFQKKRAGMGAEFPTPASFREHEYGGALFTPTTDSEHNLRRIFDNQLTKQQLGNIHTILSFFPMSRISQTFSSLMSSLVT